MFFARTYGTAKGYGDYVYQCEVDDNAIFTNGDLPYLEDGAAGTALREVMAERGIDEIHFDLCWQAVVSEELDFQEREDWADHSRNGRGRRGLGGSGHAYRLCP